MNERKNEKRSNSDATGQRLTQKRFFCSTYSDFIIKYFGQILELSKFWRIVCKPCKIVSVFFKQVFAEFGFYSWTWSCPSVLGQFKRLLYELGVLKCENKCKHWTMKTISFTWQGNFEIKLLCRKPCANASKQVSLGPPFLKKLTFVLYLFIWLYVTDGWMV